MLRYLIGLSFLILSSYSFAQEEIDRVEPPFWWVGMQNTTLQLLIYGENISTYTPSIKSNKVKLIKTHQADSPNYIFIDLEIDAATTAGSFDIQFEDKRKNSFSYRYELKARDDGSAMRKGFSPKDVMYLITPDRFANGDTSNDEIAGLKEGLNRAQDYGRHGGDIAGIAQHLDYIKDMGFTSIWLNPVLINDQPKWSYHGYATTDYYKVDPRFGTNNEYVALSKTAKKQGIGMIMDIIVNHCGSEHWWMQDPPFRDWINYQEDTTKTFTNHRKSTLLDPYVAPSQRKIMTNGWFVAEMPDLNQKNSFMSTYLIQNTIWWIEYADLAGVRQDTYSYPFRDFMTDWTCAIMNEYPNFSIVGEEWVRNPNIISYWQKDKVNQDGYTSCLGSLMDFPMTMNLHEALREVESWNTGLVKLYEGLADDHLYAHPEELVIFPDNHDMSRIFSQVEEDYDLFKIAIGYILTMRGTPQIYYGTEILMHNRGTESHGVIRSDFPGGWEGDSTSVFSGEGIDSLAMQAKNWMQKLLKWRLTSDAIHSGTLMHYEPKDGVYSYFRALDNKQVAVFINKNETIKTVDIATYPEQNMEGKRYRNVVTEEIIEVVDGVHLPAKAILILESVN